MSNGDAHLIKAAILKALAHPNRLRMLERLSKGEQSVNQLASVLGISQPTASRHLSTLKQGGLVAARQDGASVIYRLQDDKIVGRLHSHLTELLRRKLQVDQELVRSVKET